MSINCGIHTKEGSSTLESLLQDAIMTSESEKDFKLKIEKIYKDTVEQDNLEEFNKVFLEILNDTISSFVDFSTWAGDYAGNKQLLETIYLLHQEENNDRDLEGDKTEINKEDVKDGSFLYRVYGTSSAAKTDLEQRFSFLLGQSVFFNPETLSEIRTEQDFNRAIIYKLNEVYQNFLKNYDGPFRSEFPEGYLFDNIHDIIYKLSKITEFKQATPYKVSSWFNNKNKKRIEAFQNWFILNNFDKLIQLNFSDVIKINSTFKIGKLDFLPSDNKYSIIVGNKHLNQGWSSDDDLSDAVKESSGLLRLLFNSLEKRNAKGQVQGNLSFNEVTAFWTRLRNMQYHKNANTLVIPTDNLSEELKNYLTEYTVDDDGFPTVQPKFTLAQLIREIPNSSLAIEALFAIMYNDLDINEGSKRYNIKMYYSDKLILKSLYEQVFSPDSVIYKTYHQQQNNDTIKFGETPKNYLNFIEQFFTSTTHITMTQLQANSTGAYELHSISASNQRNQVARLRGSLNIAFSAQLDKANQKKKEFNTFEIDETDFKRANEKGSQLVIKLKGTNDTLTITPNLKVSYSRGSIDLEVNKELANFIQEVLNINGDFNIILTQFRSLDIKDDDLVNFAGEILYNKTVSSKILNANNLSAAKNIAKTYYFDTLADDLSMKKGSLEVNSFFSKPNYNTAIKITQAIDLLNGINRDTIGRGADGNLVNSRTTQQLAASAAEQIQRSLESPNSAVRSLKTLQTTYKGVEYARDLAGIGFNKKVTEFSPAERMAFDFIYDFAVNYVNPKDGEENIIRILPLVISDKTRILKSLANISAICPQFNKPYNKLSLNELQEVIKSELGDFYEHTYNQIKQDWESISLMALQISGLLNYYGSEQANNDVLDLINIAKAENLVLFNISEGFSNINNVIDQFRERKSNEVYTSILNYVDPSFSEIPVNSEIVKIFNDFVIQLAIDSDQTAETIEQNIKDALLAVKNNIADNSQISLVEQWKGAIKDNIKQRSSIAVKNLLNALQLEQQRINPSNKIQIIENSYYTIDKKTGHFIPNLALLEELYRWEKISKDDLIKFGLSEDLIRTSRGNYKQFFKEKNLQCLSDTLQDGTTITLSGKFGQEIKDKQITKLIEYLNEQGIKDGSGNWVTKGGSVILGKIKYQDYNEDGELVNKFLMIKNAQSLTGLNILNFAVMHYSEIEPSFNFDSIEDYFDDSSFSLKTLEKIINVYLDYQNEALFSEKAALTQQAETINRVTKKYNQRVERYQKQIEIFRQQGNNEKIQQFEGYILNLRNDFQEKIENINDYYSELSSKRKDFKKKRIKKQSQKASILVNPLLEKFNTFSYLFGQEFTNATVGSYINHPGKKLTSLKEYCSNATSQQTKRNVSESAAKHVFRLNLFDGLPSNVRSAIITNTQDLVSTLVGEISDVFDYDGALFTNGITNYLENNSLKSDSVGVDKKLFIHDYNDPTGTGKIIKCAGFSATNWRIRNSYLWRDLNYKALVGEESVIAPYLINGGIDITKAFNGAKLDFGPIIYKKVCPSRGEFGNQDYLAIYEGDTELNLIGHIIEVSNIDGFDETTGRVQFTINDITANTINHVSAQIKNAHDLWLFFGGAYSMDNVNSTEYNEKSFEKAAFAVNYIGTIDKSGKVNQYLKEAMIHYMPSVECTKQGACNINDITLFQYKQNKLSTFMLNLYDAGVQLNAEHESDESVLSMMTQVINALGARGYTAEEAREVYQALNYLTSLTLSDYLDAVIEQNPELSKQKLQNFISNVFWKVLKSQSKNINSDNLADCLLFQATELIKQNKHVDFNSIREVIPMDDPMFLRALTSKVASILVSTGIKMKFPGTMDVLVPSNGFFRLYNDKMLSSYEEGIDNLPEQPIAQVSDIKIGRTYHLVINKGNGTIIDKTINVKTPREYYHIKRYISENTLDGLLTPNIQLSEVVSAGRELAGYNFTFKSINGRQYNMWDLDNVKNAFISGNRVNLNRTLQESLNALNPNDNTINPKVQINGEDVVIDKTSIIEEPYEIVMSMLYKSQFGLRNGDDVQSIVKDGKFFLKRMLEQRKSNLDESQFDIEIKTIDGNHKYLICDDNIPNGFTISDNVQENEQGERWYCDAKGRPIFQLNQERGENGELVYTDEIYSNGKTLLIKTKDPAFHIDSTNNVGIEISSRLIDKSDDQINIIFNNLKNSSNRFVKGMLEAYKKFSQDFEEATTDKMKEFIKFKNETRDVDIQDLEEALKNNDEIKFLEVINRSSLLRNMNKKASQIHTSFIKSLDILAARIPAQCMQSFMAMKVVGFDESGLNSAYVSNHQIYLQGSDFDIDKVSLLGFQFRYGIFLKWSPYMNLNSEESLRASEHLPFPSGKEVQVLEKTNEKLVSAINYLINNAKYEDDDYIPRLVDIIKQVEKFGGIPSGLNEKVQEEIKKIIDTHNLYIKKKGVDVKGALINFVSTYMYNISKNPVNLIQSTASVDSASENGPKEKIKRLSEENNYSERLKNVDPGSITSLYRTMALTLGGKSNTGIVAASLKVFEGYLQYVYNILNNGSPEQMQKLLVNREICGEQVGLLANSYQQLLRRDTPQSVLESLEYWKNNPTDFYLMFSAFLSFATDNAKDPRLPRINAEQKMIGLYLAGFTLGINIETLIPLLTSKAALKIVQLTRSNSFNQDNGLFDIESVIDFLNHPDINKIVPYMNKTVINFLEKLHNNDEDESGEFNATTYANKLLRNKKGWFLRTLEKEIKSGKSEDIQSIRRFYNKIKAYTDLQNSIRKEEINIVNSKGETVTLRVFQEITKLELMHKEMLNFSKITKLNQGVPVTVDEQINWLRSFESIISKRIQQGYMLDEVKADEAKKALKALNEQILNIPKEIEDRERLLSQVNFKAFVENETYRKGIIQIYDSLKFGVNIFAAAENLAHYNGYQKVLSSLITIQESVSSTWNLANNISSTIDPNKESTNSIINWVNSSTISEFLSNLKNEFLIGNLSENPYYVQKIGNQFGLDLIMPDTNSTGTTINLGTTAGNATFKYVVENIVIPRLKEKYKNNKLLQDLVVTETDKTTDKNSFTKLATSVKLIPSNDFERQVINDYRLGLNYIKSEEIPEFPIFDLNGQKLGNLNFLDILFLYNLIVNENKSGENNLTALFQDFVFSTDSQSSIIHSYFEFRKIQESYLLSKIGTMKKSDIEAYKQTTAKLFKLPISDSDKRKNKYIFVKDNTNKVRLCERIDTSSTNEAYDELGDQIDVTDLSQDSSYIDEFLAQEAIGDELEEYSSYEQFVERVKENGYVVRGIMTSLTYSATPVSSSLRQLIKEIKIPADLIKSGKIDAKVLKDVKQNPC